ncbi:uncharacterized protein [Amphiura filiformis]|uniref:uncharacterized protein n=1 Tax=Amphiura filiformis TaxID=82378 RepID=UPI003B217E13
MAEHELRCKPEFDDSLMDERVFLKKPVRFRAKHDIYLLKCAISRNPFGCRVAGDAKYLNETIADDMNKAFEDEGFSVCQRRVRERYQLLLRQYQHEDLALHLRRKRSKGDTEEENKEKIQLLQECTELQLQEEKVGRVYKARIDRKELAPIPIKLNTITDDVNYHQNTSSFSASVSSDGTVDVALDDNRGSPSPPPLKRQKKSDTNELLDYFHRKDAEEGCYKEKELELKERELRLKERELDIRERELQCKLQQTEEGDATGKAALLSLLMKHLK